MPGMRNRDLYGNEDDLFNHDKPDETPPPPGPDPGPPEPPPPPAPEPWQDERPFRRRPIPPAPGLSGPGPRRHDRPRRRWWGRGLGRGPAQSRHHRRWRHRFRRRVRRRTAGRGRHPAAPARGSRRRSGRRYERRGLVDRLRADACPGSDVSRPVNPRDGLGGTPPPGGGNGPGGGQGGDDVGLTGVSSAATAAVGDARCAGPDDGGLGRWPRHPVDDRER